MSEDKKIDILAIGDIAAEPFIKIKDSDAEETCNPVDGHCKLCLNFGSKIPYESSVECFAVGNSSNVAISTSRLGLESSLVSYIGDDNIGRENLMTLNKEKVNTDYINTVSGFNSNYHYVLWYQNERTILTKHTEFPYSFPKDIKEPKLIYLSSLASNSIPYHKEIMEYVKQHPNVSLIFQPGTFQIKLGVESLREIYANTKIFISNKEEAKKILKTEDGDIKNILSQIYNLGPKIVVITDNISGAYSFDGEKVLFMKAFPQGPFVESTGAGDAFSGAFITAISLDKSIEEALMWGAANAVSTISYVGPHKGLLNRNQIEEFLKDKSDYKPNKVD